MDNFLVFSFLQVLEFNGLDNMVICLNTFIQSSINRKLLKGCHSN